MRLQIKEQVITYMAFLYVKEIVPYVTDYYEF